MQVGVGLNVTMCGWVAADAQKNFDFVLASFWKEFQSKNYGSDTQSQCNLGLKKIYHLSG